jgi:hypothetical protein
MESTTKINPYKSLGLRERLYGEAFAMAEAALSRGLEVPATAVAAVEAFEGYFGTEGQAPAELLNDLVSAHHTLAVLLAPATPRTILLLNAERDTNAFMRFLGPIGLIRHLMLAAIISLLVFVGVSMTSYTDFDTTKPAVSILNGSGIPLLMNLLLYLSAAGLGGSFACLYTVKRFVVQGTFDPMYVGSYWIRFFLGLISGLLLCIVVSENLVKSNTYLEPGIFKVLTAILGGFSADLLFTFLNRFLEAFKSLFQGAASEIVQTQVERIKTRLASQQAEDQLQVAASVMRIQQTIGASTNPEEIKQKLNDLMNQVLPPKTGGS